MYSCDALEYDKEGHMDRVLWKKNAPGRRRQNCLQQVVTPVRGRQHTIVFRLEPPLELCKDHLPWKTCYADSMNVQAYVNLRMQNN